MVCYREALTSFEITKDLFDLVHKSGVSCECLDLLVGDEQSANSLRKVRDHSASATVPWQD